MVLLIAVSITLDSNHETYHKKNQTLVNYKYKKMKNIFKSAGVKIPAIISLLALSPSVFAGIEHNAAGESPLSAGQVILYFIIMIALIIGPVFKRPQRKVE